MEAALAPQLFIQLTPKTAWYRPSILGQGSVCKNKATLLSGTWPGHISVYPTSSNVAQASCECLSAKTMNHVIGSEDNHENKNHIGHRPTEN